MNRFVGLLVAAALLGMPLSVNALTFKSGEKKSFDKASTSFIYHQQVDEKYPFQISQEVARLGEKSQRFELRHGDCEVISKIDSDRQQNNRLSEFHCSTGRERVQVGSKGWKPGEDMWWGISMFIPNNFRPDQKDICTMFMQIKQIEFNGPSMEQNEGLVGEASQDQTGQSKYKYALGHGVFGLGICGPEIGICVNKTWGPKFNTNYRCIQRHVGYLSRFVGSWVDFTFHYDTRNFASGETLLEVWVNGEKIGNYRNVTEHFPEIYRPQYGLYRSQFKGKENGPKQDLVVYFDEVRYGQSYDEVAVQMQSEPND